MTARGLPPVSESDLLAYVDGRLDARRRAEVEAHLGASPDDARRIAADIAILDGLRVLFDHVAIAAAARPAQGRPGRRRGARAWLARLALGLILLAGGFAGGWTATARPDAVAAAPVVQCGR